MSEPLYYVQDKRQIVGNSMYWWKAGNHGYCCDLQQARIFSEKDAQNLINESGHKYRMWPKTHIDAHVQHHVDFQCVDDTLATP